jgi:sugar lactone lactonase YvrE
MTGPRILLSGRSFGESPRWHDDRLWFADWGTGEILAVDMDGRSEVVVRLSGLPISIDWLPDGRMLLVSGAQRRLLRREPDGSLVAHAELAGLSDHPWNEIVVDGRGNAYINSIGFDFPGGEFAPGVVALVTPAGEVRQVADGLAFPNGMAITPDEATLIVAESYADRLTAFDIGSDGDLSNRRAWAEVPGDHPDGICLDAEGAAWYADVGGRHCTRVREGGEVLGVIELDRGCFACVLGGPDRRTLFMIANEWSGTADMMAGRTGQVLTAEAPAPGAGRP